MECREASLRWTCYLSKDLPRMVVEPRVHRYTSVQSTYIFSHNWNPTPLAIFASPVGHVAVCSCLPWELEHVSCHTKETRHRFQLTGRGSTVGPVVPLQGTVQYEANVPRSDAISVNVLVSSNLVCSVRQCGTENMYDMVTRSDCLT